MMKPFPQLFLAPMAGVTNTIFRQICLDMGADVLTSEFVSADGILHRNQRTREYLEFAERERPVGVQLFGADPGHLAEATRCVIDWVRPDFVDLNFGCPVNKVVCRQGGSALLRDCPLLEKVARAVVAAAGSVPVTAKIRIGWSRETINATTTAAILEGAGIARIAVHGRTKEQGYSGEADWDVIGSVATAVTVPVIGNGDISSADDARRRVDAYPVAGLMIGRAAMANPWIFSEIKASMAGASFEAPSVRQRWELIADHARREVRRRGNERSALSSMRSRLMAYSRSLPHGKALRSRFSQVSSVAELEDIAADHLAECEVRTAIPPEGLIGAAVRGD